MDRLFKLFALNRNAAGRRFDVKSEAGETTIFLYDIIFGDDETAEWLGGVG